MRIPVLTAAAGARWESELVAALEDGTQPIAISRRCVDILDLLAIAATGQGRAALVAARLRDLDADAVDRLRACQVVPIAVVDRADPDDAEAARARGLRFTVPADAAPAVVASVVRAALADADAAVAGPGAVAGYADPLAGFRHAAARPRGSVHTAARGTGRVIAVWGPTGAPGRTTVAIGIADEIARSGRTTLLVDADVYGGSVAAVLGILDESPGLAAACRQAAGAGIDTAALAALCWQLRPTLRVLTGLPQPQRWPEIRPSALRSVLDVARSLAQCVVIDCGFGLEADEELSYDSLAPRRNGATLLALAAADLVVAVGSADPVGVQRLVRGLGELRDAQLDTAVHVVVNRARPGLFRGDPADELTAVLTRLAGRAPDTILPEDRDGVDAAVAAGRQLSELRPSSPLRRGLIGLAAAVAGVEIPAARHRRRA